MFLESVKGPIIFQLHISVIRSRLLVASIKNKLIRNVLIAMTGYDKEGFFFFKFGKNLRFFFFSKYRESGLW